MKPSKNAFAKPGLINGKVTVLKLVHRSARSVWDASSRLGDTLSTTPIKTKNAIGVKANVCAIITPINPYTQRVGLIPSHSAIVVVTVPLSPNNKIIASPMTNGGVIIGTTDNALRTLLNRNPVLTITRAKQSPSTVVMTPTETANKKELIATPQDPAPIKQSICQSFDSNNL